MSLKKKYFILLIIPVLFNCGKPDDPIVAQIGNRKISLREFNTAYFELLKKTHIMDSESVRESCLDEIITCKIFAAAASQLNLGDNEKLKYKYGAYRDKVLRELHFQHVIRSNIQINEDELTEIYSFLTQQRHIKHLFFETLEEADEAFRRLMNGEDWEYLARKIFTDAKLAESGGDLGWVHWDQMEYNLAMTIFKQKVGTFSKPVSSSFGYHIIQVIDLRMNPLISKYEYQTHRHKIRSLAEMKIGEKLAADYIMAMMAEKQIEIYPAGANFVSSRFHEVFHRRPQQQSEMNLEAQLTPQEVKSLEEIYWAERNSALAIIDGKTLTVGEFIYGLNYIPFSAIEGGFRTALNFVIRDQVLTAEAEALRLDRRYPDFRIQTGLFHDKLLQTEYRRLLIQGISISEDEILTRFERDQKTLFKNICYDDVRDSIYEILFQEKRSKVVSEQIDRMKNEIRKYPQVIHDYYDNI